MTDTTKTQYSRVPGGSSSDALHVRLENPLAIRLKAAQERPEFLIKDIRRPSRALIVRRALSFYLSQVERMNGAQLTQESLELHRLA
ncbi:hypothetical protein HBH1_00357 [Herbaspirillum sp. BH-1]|nr:hypothetical protein HBH1_00357 [Herbaspirillum sp. BH-1]